MRTGLALCVLALVLGATASSAAVSNVPSFAATKRYALANANGCDRCAVGTAIGDLNGDGRPDVVTVSGDDSLAVFITKADGTFSTRRDYLTAGDAADAVIADLNGDGHPDVAVAEADGFVSTFMNQGDGTVATRRDYAGGSEGSGPFSIAAGDLDGNGSADLVAANGSASISVLRNNGDGTFAAQRDYRLTGAGAVSLALGDLNRDRRPDVVTGAVSVLLNNGDGTFAERDYNTPDARSIALGDLNGDGKLDVAASNAYRGVSVRLNTGNGGLGRARVYAVLPSWSYGLSDGEPQSVAIADLNGDRKPDLATVNDDRRVSVLVNAGGGGFRSPIDVGIAKCGEFYESARALSTVDLNGDRRADLIAVGSAGLCVSLRKPGLCNVQDVRGRTLSVAKGLLVRGHCRPGAVRYAHEKFVKRGLVTAERPDFGRVLRAGAKVALVVSLGRP